MSRAIISLKRRILIDKTAFREHSLHSERRGDVEVSGGKHRTDDVKKRLAMPLMP